MNILRFEKIPSTQDYAKENLSSFTEPTIIISKEQSSGRGRYERKFFSPIGGLYLSFVIKWEEPYLGIIAPLGITETISKIGIETKILWPNDIVFEGKKLGGVLIEKIDGKNIIGIGINCNNKIKDFDEKLRNKITTLFEISGKKIDIEKFGVEIIENIFFLSRETQFLKEEYERRMEGIGKKGIVRINSKEEIKGEIKGISEFGALLLKIGNKTSEIISAEKLILL